MMISFTAALRALTEKFPELRIVIVRPVLRTVPSSFKSDMARLQVNGCTVEASASIY